ncbi:hypothetical protein [Fictibacillus barbaricus]|uniref:Amidohydrolase 3 domain-containing protein n=1 Tax=Fictibacillus barbaricus TaxID=182136 RepID=A0ABS2Z7Y5_9BACL|nr:hypothetical protein [Fictibacillus barbaricus]MBN3544199.1 hypothetical protein [Fictibacillus barbaricus]GGB69732.1 hypothetical protein GCM10007199_39960 [Fictibacillus barbaricus]
MFDFIIRGGPIYDGTENPWSRLDLGIKDGIISKIGDLSQEQAETEIDAKGLAVSPGFINTYVHSDLLCTKSEIHHIKVGISHVLVNGKLAVKENKYVGTTAGKVFRRERSYAENIFV